MSHLSGGAPGEKLQTLNFFDYKSYKRSDERITHPMTFATNNDRGCTMMSLVRGQQQKSIPALANFDDGVDIPDGENLDNCFSPG